MALRQVHFFELLVSHNAAQERAETANWSARIKEYCAKPAADRRLQLPSGAELVGFSSEFSDYQLLIGDVVDGDLGITRGHWSDGTAAPIEPTSADEFFSRMTYAQFLPRGNVVALLGGSGVRPSRRHVEAMANHIAPLDQGRWVSEPLVSADQRVRAKQMDGAKKATIISRIDPSGLPFDDGTKQPLDAMLASIASSIGAGLRINMTISVEAPRQHGSACQALLGAVMNSPELLDDAKRITIEAYNRDVAKEVLELIEFKMTAHVDLPDDAQASALRETALVELRNVCASLQTQAEGIAALER